MLFHVYYAAICTVILLYTSISSATPVPFSLDGSLSINQGSQLIGSGNFTAILQQASSNSGFVNHDNAFSIENSSRLLIT